MDYKDVYGDLVNLKILCRLSILKMFMGRCVFFLHGMGRCVCVYRGECICVYVKKKKDYLWLVAGRSELYAMNFYLK